MVDFFKIYKMFMQRSRRNPECRYRAEAKTIMEAIIKRDCTLAEKLDLADSLLKRERAISPKILYAKKVIAALHSGDYIVDVPFQVQHRWNETNDSEGWLYVAISPSKPGQVKLGATKNDPSRRESTYAAKYGYSIQVIWQKKVTMPFLREHQIASIFRNRLVSGLAYGDSIEWYTCPKATFLDQIEAELDRNSCSYT